MQCMSSSMQTSNIHTDNRQTDRQTSSKQTDCTEISTNNDMRISMKSIPLIDASTVPQIGTMNSIFL